jgi:cation transport ATPase
MMRRLTYALLTLEVLLVLCALGHLLTDELAVLLVAANSVLLIWSAVQLRKRPSCCR